MKLYLSPRGFFTRALWIAVAFLVVSLLGWRDETRFLSGTPASAGRGVIYAFVWFAFVLGAPVLAIGAAVFAALERRAAGNGGPT